MNWCVFDLEFGKKYLLNYFAREAAQILIQFHMLFSSGKIVQCTKVKKITFFFYQLSSTIIFFVNQGIIEILLLILQIFVKFFFI